MQCCRLAIVNEIAEWVKKNAEFYTKGYFYLRVALTPSVDQFTPLYQHFHKIEIYIEKDICY